MVSDPRQQDWRQRTSGGAASGGPGGAGAGSGLPTGGNPWAGRTHYTDPRSTGGNSLGALGTGPYGTPGTVTGGSGGGSGPRLIPGSMAGRATGATGSPTWSAVGSQGGANTGGYQSARVPTAASNPFAQQFQSRSAITGGAGTWRDFTSRIWQETSPWRSTGTSAVNDLNTLRDRGYFQVDAPDLPKWNEDVFRSEYADGRWGNPFFEQRQRDADATTMRGLHNSGVGTGSGAGLYALAQQRAQVHSDDFNQARGRARDAYGLATQEGLTGYDLERNERNQEYSRLAQIAGMGLGATQDTLGRVAQGIGAEDAAAFRDWQAQDQADFRNFAHFDQADFRERQFADQTGFRNWQAQDQAGFRNYQYADQAGFRNWQAQDQADFRNYQYADQAGFRNYQYEDQAGFRNWQAQDEADFRNFAHLDQTNFRDRNYEDEYNFRERSYADQLTMYERDYEFALKELEVNREIGQRANAAQARRDRWNTIGNIIGIGAKLLSDPALKEDMTPIDKLPNGLTIYSYRFRDKLDGTGELRIGLDAAEVQELMPQHVGEHLGYLTVDYEAVIDEAMAEAD